MTGAASGMGRAVAEKLTAAGHTVIDVDIVDATVTGGPVHLAGRRERRGGGARAVRRHGWTVR